MTAFTSHRHVGLTRRGASRAALSRLIGFVLVALIVAGCGNSSHKTPRTAVKAKQQVKTASGPVDTPLPEALNTGGGTPADRSAGKQVPLAPQASALGAPARKKVATIDVRPAAQRLQAQESNAVPPNGTNADYEQFVRAVVPLINDFWQQKAKRVSPGTRYQPPGHLVSYNGTDAPGCAGKKSADFAGNAYYCPVVIPPAQCRRVAPNNGYCIGEDIIAWDTPGLLLPYFREIGDLATALVLAHEWGHLIQARVFPQFDYHTVIRRELQADCYAGAWALGMQRQGRVDLGSFNQTLDLFEKIGGSGDAWLDPASHGNKFQRIRAFTQGFENDAKGCIGGRFDAVLQRVGLAPERAGG
jgi:predicted metalloprotease